ncbi:MAG TPA: oxidoreductase, partial [Gemmatimonadales bacterium]|nr:oxidoreductase [Gemmatimonadales bacterium]
MLNPDPAPPLAGDTTFAERVRAAVIVLEQLVADRTLLAHVPTEDQRRLLRAAGDVLTPDARSRRRLVKATIRLQKAARVNRDEGALRATGIRRLRKQGDFNTPNVFPPRDFRQTDVDGEPDFREAVEPQNCYVCKQDYSTIHHFYDQLCPSCSDLNFRKRTELADLRGRVALLTGGRVKIGYQAGLKLLRAGAHLLVTTRFPRDSARRYAAEPDFEEWGHRL